MLIIATMRLSWNGGGPRVGCSAGRKYPAVGPVQSMVVFFFCCPLRRLARLALLRSYQRLAPPVALDIHLQDRCSMDQTVHGSHRRNFIGEDLAPVFERLVGDDGK